MAVVTMRQMLDAGVHFGHQTRRWNPKMKRFIFTERNGIYIIDLQQTLQYVDRAYEFIRETVAHGGTVLFIGTKRQAQEAIAEQATRVSMPYVNQRWLGGMLTNFQTVHKRLQRLKDLEAMETSGEFAGRTKKEVLLLTREKDKLAKTLGGIRDMAKIPSAVWIVDTKKEHIAVGEARKLNIPVVAVLDTNCDPDEVDYPVPGNDDAIRSAALLTKVVAEAVAEGLLARSGGLSGGSSTEEPLAEWERELLASGAAEAATSEAAAAEAAAPVESAAPLVESAPVDAIAETEAGAEALLEVQADSIEGVAEIVPNEQVSVVAPGSSLN
jgi:small subunit ribosomal protein S2